MLEIFAATAWTYATLFIIQGVRRRSVFCFGYLSLYFVNNYLDIEKAKMAAGKPEVVLSPLIKYIDTSFKIRT